MVDIQPKNTTIIRVDGIREKTSSALTIGTVGSFALNLRSVNLTRYGLDTSGNFAQDATNGGDIIVSKALTGIISGVASRSSAHTTQLGYAPLYIAGTSALSNGVDIISYGATTGVAGIDFFKTRTATPIPTTIVQANDRVGQMRFWGCNGTSYDQVAVWRVEIDNLGGATPGSSNDMPGRHVFLTTPDASATPIEAFRIDSAQAIAFSPSQGIIKQQANTGSIALCGGLTTSASQGGRVEVFAISHASNAGQVNVNAGNTATGHINLSLANASGLIRCTNAAGAFTWTIAAAGDITQDATNGGSLIISKAATGIILGSTARDSDVTTFASNPLLYVAGGNNHGVFVQRSADATGGSLKFLKTRATTDDANTAVQASDNVFSFQFGAANGTSYGDVAGIYVTMDAPVSGGGASDTPGRITFHTTPDGSSTPAEALRIDSAKNCKLSGRLVETLSATDVDAQNNTLTIAQIVAGIVVHTSVTGAGTITVDTAANIIAGSTGGAGALTVDNQCISCLYINDGNQTLTFGGSPTGITYADTGQTIAPDESAIVYFRRTSGSTVTVYCIGA